MASARGPASYCVLEDRLWRQQQTRRSTPSTHVSAADGDKTFQMESQDKPSTSETKDEKVKRESEEVGRDVRPSRRRLVARKLTAEQEEEEERVLEHLRAREDKKTR